jgi:thioredoxin 1
MKVLTSSELKEKINNGETFIVDMYADWCGPCRVLGPIVERVSKKLQEENVGIGVYKFDIESDKEYAVSLGIRSIPTIKAFKGGEQVTTKVGVIQENDLMSMAKSML